MLELRYLSKGRVVAADQSTKDLLKKGYFGKEKGRTIELSVIEALYLLDSRNASCTDKRGRSISFTDLAKAYQNREKFMAKYFSYKDWRDRGLVIEEPSFAHQNPNKTPVKHYPTSRLNLPRRKLKGTFFKTDLMSVLEDQAASKELYNNYWLGQYGTYKAAERGRLSKLDVYETLFLAEKGILVLNNVTKAGLVALATSRRRDFPRLYEVFKDWRDKGYVIKTGFKFGTHFRVYFPGAKPMQASASDWAHSRHVIHVFPKDARLLISEWARAIRVAHSVKKTFILAVPGKIGVQKEPIDYLLYHRKGGEAESPARNAPRYAMLSLGEEEYIGGKGLAGAIRTAKASKLELILAIVDRETAVTYYKVRQIELPRSKHEYYEIDWMQP